MRENQKKRREWEISDGSAFCPLAIPFRNFRIVAVAICLMMAVTHAAY